MAWDEDSTPILPEKTGPRPRRLEPVKPYVMPDVTPQDADDKLQEMIPDALSTLADCLGADSEHVKLQAARLILELTGCGQKKGANVNAEAAAIQEQLEALLRRRIGNG